MSEHKDHKAHEPAELTAEQKEVQARIAKEQAFVQGVCADALNPTGGIPVGKVAIVFVETASLLEVAKKAAPGLEVQVDQTLSVPALWRVCNSTGRPR